MKIQKFKGVVVTPVRKTVSGILTAPSMYITEVDGMNENKKYEEAIKIAKQRSGLGRFDSWEFV